MGMAEHLAGLHQKRKLKLKVADEAQRGLQKVKKGKKSTAKVVSEALSRRKQDRGSY